MSHFHVDFRLAHVPYELWALGEYLSALEFQLPRRKEQQHLRSYAQLQEHDLLEEEAEVDLALQELHEIADNVLPRFLWGPFLVSLWSVYESGVVDAASYLQKKKNLQVSMVHGIRQRGRGFLMGARDYFAHTVDFPLCTDPKAWSRLEMLLTLRNIINHRNGRVDGLTRDRQIRLKQYLQQDIGISIDTSSRFLIFSEAFVHETYSIVNASLSDLVERIRATPA